MICIHHNKDMDGYTSGAVVKLKYPDCKLIGWDYKDPIPDFEQFKGEDIIMIDITFPINKIKELIEVANHLTIIDHHVSFVKDFYKEIMNDIYCDSCTLTGAVLSKPKLKYVYASNKAACEIGWEYFFPNIPTPYAVTLIGRYDTWRKEEGNWRGETLPFKYFMYSVANKVEDIPSWCFQYDEDNIYEACELGISIMDHENKMNESASKNYSFERDFKGLRAICLNVPYFSSETLKSVYNPEKHDIMIGFNFTGSKYIVSLRSDKDEVDCSIIAKSKGGGGHKGAAGFESSSIDNIFN